MSLTALPPELHVLIVTHLLDGEDGSTQSVSSMTRTCNALSAIYQPILYRDLRLDQAHDVLLSVAYAIFTKPSLGKAVRSIRFPDLSLASSSRGWPAHVDSNVIRYQVSVALGDQSAQTIETCSKLVCNGTREDLIAMLVLTNTPNLERLAIQAMGPRDDNSCTRAIFQHAVPRLTKLSVVEFGQEPREGELEQRQYDELSYAHFADLLRLPAVESIFAHQVTTDEVIGMDEDDLEACFSMIRDIDTDNTSLKSLVISEQFASRYAYLDNLLARCPALEFLEFEEAKWYTAWDSIWSVKDFETALEGRADSLSCLILNEFLFRDEYGGEDADERSEIDLSNLDHLTHLYVDQCWIFDTEGEDDDDATIRAAENDRHRLISMLPDSIMDITLQLRGALFIPGFHDSVICALETLVQRHRDHQWFPDLSYLSIQVVSVEIQADYEKALEFAWDAGLTVQVIPHQGQGHGEEGKETKARWMEGNRLKKSATAR